MAPGNAYKMPAPYMGTGGDTMENTYRQSQKLLYSIDGRWYYNSPYENGMDGEAMDDNCVLVV